MDWKSEVDCGEFSSHSKESGDSPEVKKKIEKLIKSLIINVIQKGT